MIHMLFFLFALIKNPVVQAFVATAFARPLREKLVKPAPRIAWKASPNLGHFVVAPRASAGFTGDARPKRHRVRQNVLVLKTQPGHDGNKMLESKDPLTLEYVSDIPPERRIFIQRTNGRDIFDVHDIEAYGRYLEARFCASLPVVSVMNPSRLVDRQELLEVARRARNIHLKDVERIALACACTLDLGRSILEALALRFFVACLFIVALQQWAWILRMSIPSGAYSMISGTLAGLLTDSEIRDIFWTFCDVFKTFGGI